MEKGEEGRGAEKEWKQEGVEKEWKQEGMEQEGMEGGTKGVGRGQGGEVGREKDEESEVEGAGRSGWK